MSSSSSTPSLILSLPNSHQAVLSALTCEKMLPSIVKFDQGEANQGQHLFEKSITAIFSFSLGFSADLEEYKILKDEVEAFWPDLDESQNEFASYAFDACLAMTEALNFVINKDSTHVINCITAATDTVDMYVQDISDLDPATPDLNSIIDANPVMITEVKRQRLIAESLAETPVISSSYINGLRALNGQEDIVDLSVL